MTPVRAAVGSRFLDIVPFAVPEPGEPHEPIPPAARGPFRDAASRTPPLPGESPTPVVMSRIGASVFFPQCRLASTRAYGFPEGR